MLIRARACHHQGCREKVAWQFFQQDAPGGRVWACDDHRDELKDLLQIRTGPVKPPAEDANGQLKLQG